MSPTLTRIVSCFSSEAAEAAFGLLAHLSLPFQLGLPDFRIFAREPLQNFHGLTVEFVTVLVSPVGIGRLSFEFRFRHFVSVHSPPPSSCAHTMSAPRGWRSTLLRRSLASRAVQTTSTHGKRRSRPHRFRRFHEFGSAAALVASAWR
jgi:hypothetical protein